MLSDAYSICSWGYIIWCLWTYFCFSDFVVGWGVGGHPSLSIQDDKKIPLRITRHSVDIPTSMAVGGPWNLVSGRIWT